MTNEEAKALYVDAVKLFEAQAYADALDKFEHLDAERPNSRHVTYHRCVCLAHLDRKDEAREHFARIDGKLERDKDLELKRLLKEQPSHSDSGYDFPEAPPADSSADLTGNVLVIESAFPKSTDETTITGHVKSGAFRTGDSLTLVTESGMPLVAPIVRIGTAETPLKMVRAGQKAIMLIQVEPHHVVPGSIATCITQEESYAETMVVGMNAGPQSTASQSEGKLLELERKLRQGDYAGIKDKLAQVLAEQPDSCPAHRLMARVYLEGGQGIQDPKRALDHIRRAYELGGAEDPVVVDTLAQAMAANGEAQHGLRFLERLYSSTREFEAKNALAQRIIEFRTRHKLGHMWEFADSYGDVIFEASEIHEIVRAIKTGTVPKTALCKRDRVGEWRKVEETLALEYPDIGALFKAEAAGSRSVLLYVVIAALAAVLVFVLINLSGGGAPQG